MIHGIGDAMKRQGISDVVSVDLFGNQTQTFRAVIVGGGELIRPVGDAFYDRFRLAGGTVLCAVGVWSDADKLDYLREYDVVTARSSSEVRTLREAGIDARVMPCPTVAMEPSGYVLPRKDRSRQVGVHLVPDTLIRSPHVVEIVNEICGEKWKIPFTRYLRDDLFMSGLPLSGTPLPNDLSPRDLRSAIGQMDLVVASSLHVTLFALASGVPFVTMDQPKVRAYLEDRDLQDLIFHDDESLRRALGLAPGFVDTIRQTAQRDREVVDEFFEDVARRCVDDGNVVHIDPLSHNPGADRMSFLRTQTWQVMGARDRLVSALFERQLETGRLSTLLDGERRWNAEQQGALSAVQKTIASQEGELKRQAEILHRLRFLIPLTRLGSGVRSRLSRRGVQQDHEDSGRR